LIHGSRLGMGRGKKPCPGAFKTQKAEVQHDLRTIH
jgi:hypothetical protein